MSSEDVEVSLAIRAGGTARVIDVRVAESALCSARFDALAHAVGTMLAELRSSFPNLPQRESAGKSSEFKTALEPQDYRQILEGIIAEVERENAAALGILNRWNEICEMGLPDIVTPSLKPVLFELWDATNAALDAARKEGGAK